MDYEILKNHQIPGKVIDIIEETKVFCFLVTPYFKSWPLLKRALEKAGNNNKKISIILRSCEDVTDEIKELSRKYGFDVAFVDRLHTKLYMNEKEVLISSMNLYDSSKENNYELGFNIKGTNVANTFKYKVIDQDLLSLKYDKLIKGKYIKSSAADEKPGTHKKTKTATAKTNQKKQVFNKTKAKTQNQGHCIRCNTQIGLDPDHPYCKKCYKLWSQYENPEYTEKYCHHCGKKSSTSLLKPVCYSCWQASK